MSTNYLPASETVTAAQYDYRLIHDVYVVLDAIDRCIFVPLGLTNTQYRLLTLLDGKQGCRLTDLSDQMICNRSTITRLIDKLEAKGLVQRINTSDDRRVQRVALTPDGAALQKKAARIHQHSLDERLNQLTSDEQIQLGHLLEKTRLSLRSNLELQERYGERSVQSFDLDE